jgi:hypothetical protein
LDNEADSSRLDEGDQVAASWATIPLEGQCFLSIHVGFQSFETRHRHGKTVMQGLGIDICK